jgi:hypothetical protein
MTTRVDPICRASPQRDRGRRGGFGLPERHDLSFILRVSMVSKYTKRSQFPAVAGVQTNPISAGRDTPSFQYSTIPAFPPDANRAKQTQFGTGRAGCVEAWGMRRVVQTNPISAPATVDSLHHSSIPLFQPSRPMPIVRHRLNAPLRETNPIWRRQGRVRRGLGDEACCTNKPNLAGRPLWPVARACAGRLYKQTQFRPVATGLAAQTNPISANQARCTNKPNLAVGPAGPLVQTNPISLVGPAPEQQNVRNKPNLRACSECSPDGIMRSVGRRRFGSPAATTAGAARPRNARPCK